MSVNLDPEVTKVYIPVAVIVSLTLFCGWLLYQKASERPILNKETSECWGEASTNNERIACLEEAIKKLEK